MALDYRAAVEARNQGILEQARVAVHFKPGAPYDSRVAHRNNESHRLDSVAGQPRVAH